MKINDPPSWSKLQKQKQQKIQRPNKKICDTPVIK